MKVGIYDPYLDAPGGGEKYMLTIADCLSVVHEVDVFWDDKKDLQNIEKKFALALSELNVKPNIFSSRFGTLERLRATMPYDIIIFLSDGSVPVVLSKKLIVHFQFPVEWVDGRSLKSWLKLRRVSHVICNSKFTKSYIDKKFGVESVVLYPPVDTKLKSILKKENIILHVGRFAGNKVEGTDYKKQHVLIQVFKDMIDEGLKSWKLVLAVSVLDRDREAFLKMKKKATDYPIEFIVNSTRQEVLKLYSKAKIYWHASGYGEDLVKSPEKAEHFGISTVEAMVEGGVPVVINAGGLKEIVKNNVNGFLWNTLDELKDKTSELINNSTLWKQLSNSAKTSVDTFNTNRFCIAINEIISKT